MPKAVLTSLAFCFVMIQALAVRASESFALPENATCADLAILANRFVDMGRDRAIAELEKLSDGPNGEGGFGASRQLADRLCAILFAYGNDSHRRFLTGGFFMLPFLTMRRDDWPYYPLAESDGVFFALADGEVLAGFRFGLKYDFDSQGSKIVFRKDHLKVPSPQDASLALDRLIGSDVWKKIKWEDSGNGSKYSYSEKGEIAILRGQIPRGANQSTDPAP
jgi:hypothetical protein